jgi:hypothetical protein
MTVGTDIVDAVAGALRAAELRVAVTQGDLVPPCFWLAAEGAESTGTLADARQAIFYLYWLPVRGLGVGDTARNLDAMLDACDALAAIGAGDLRWTSVQLVLDPTGPWFAYRAPITVYASIVDTTTEED